MNKYKEDVQIANKYMKRCLAPLIIREMQITPVRMAIIKKTRDKFWQWGGREEKASVHCWQKCKLVQPL